MIFNPCTFSILCFKAGCFTWSAPSPRAIIKNLAMSEAWTLHRYFNNENERHTQSKLSTAELGLNAHTNTQNYPWSLTDRPFTAPLMELGSCRAGFHKVFQTFHVPEVHIFSTLMQTCQIFKRYNYLSQ